MTLEIRLSKAKNIFVDKKRTIYQDPETIHDRVNKKDNIPQICQEYV